MTSDEWLERIAGIRQWSRGGERAPHKPLLLLYSLGRLQRTGATVVAYRDAEPSLTQLLHEYGPPGRRSTPAYPFHHLQTDALWRVTTPDGIDPGTSVTRLRSAATGQLDPDFEEALRRDPSLMVVIARALLDENFPESLHADICDAVGLDLEGIEVSLARRRAASLPATVARRRDPEFRRNVLVAYEYRCAMCGYDGRLGTEAVGLDAAHVRWWAFDGPDDIDNALCLCSFHHKLLDRGVVGVTSDHTITVSSHFIGRGVTAAELVLRLVGRALIEPQPGLPPPAPEHVRWHEHEVFRAPARQPA